MVAIQNSLGGRGGISAWSASRSYAIGDLAVLSGVIYVAKTANTNQSPAADTSHTYWEIVLNTGNKDLVIKVVEQNLDDTGFTPVTGTLYQHVGASSANFKINGLYYRTASGYVDAFSIDAGGVFVGYVSDSSTAFPTARQDGSALQSEDYSKPAATATLPFTVAGITFNDRNDEAHYDGSAWYLKPGAFKTGNIGVTDASTESIDGTKTTQAAINAEFVKAIKEGTARYITADAAGNAFATHAALTGATKYYYAGAETTPDTNDYAIVSADEDHNNAQTRYLWQDGTPSGTWAFQYVLNFAIADASLLATSDGIKVLLKTNGGLGLDSTDPKGIFVKLASDGALENSSGSLGVKLATSSALAKDANGLKVVANTSKSLEIDSTNGLQVKSKGAIKQDATDGLYVSVQNGIQENTTDNALELKLDSAGGLSVGTNGLGVTNSIAAETTGKGSATKTVTLKHDAHGLITGLTEQDIQTASTSQVGVVQLDASISSSSDDTKAVTPKAVKSYVDSAVKHTFTAFSIAVADWQAEVSSSLDTNFKATVTATGATTNDMLQIYFALASLKPAGECGIVADITAADTITFYAVDKPAAAISGKYEILVSA